MLNDKPVSIVEDGCYTTYIQDNVIPDLLKVIENSGLSFVDARRVPKELEKAIENAASEILNTTIFRKASASDAQ